MKESEIRPEHLHQRYLELSAQDALLCFGNDPRRDIPCVACGSSRVEPQFEKNGFGFAICSDCRTLYQSPRPSIEAFENFYRDSVSSRYWAEEFFPAVAEARRASIFRPRVERLQALCAERGISVRRLIEVGSGFGTFLDEWKARSPDTELFAIEPSKKMAAVCREKGFAVAEDIVENVKGMGGHGDLVVCFEVLEHVYDPVSFLKTLGALVRPGGYVFISTLGVDGFDIQTLWEKSNSISPPHHINFLSIEGFKKAFARAGFSDVGVTTPGKLDVDIVRNADARDPSLLKGNRFAKTIVRDAEKGALFQKFLAENLLSSHVWVLARREF
jgi:2-polyprenyl-3-methyl-5-hydroxy-6-metoxy-1,4-benzoquinol methylase